MSKFSRNPSTKQDPVSIEDFLAGAQVTTPKTASDQPWLNCRNDKRNEVYNLRLTEMEMAKLRYIAAHSQDSMQTFCQKILLPAIDDRLDEIQKQNTI